MGWLKLNNKPRPASLAQRSEAQFEKIKEETSQHIEHVDIHLDASEGNGGHKRPLVPLDVSDKDLPVIPSDEVKAKKDSGELWIVVDEIVYDCSSFVHEHPGGRHVIESFRGEDCSWQFWRFHSKDHMQDFGRPLRVGRTHGVKNRFKMKPRYVGLKRLGMDDDDW